MGNVEEKSEKMYRLVSAWRTSGETKKAYCASVGVNIHTFNYWIDKSVSSQEGHFGGFVPLRAPDLGLCLSFPSGATLRFGSGLSSAEMAILKTLIS